MSSMPSRPPPVCPVCANDWVRRVHRPLWMRMFKNSAAYQCDRCGKRFMVRTKPYPHEPGPPEQT